jgi:hypothetical protein
VSKTAAAGLGVGGVSASTGLTSAIREKKIAEAKELSERGMKFLKTSVFQWQPDNLAAAPLFESSSNAYKAANDLENARIMMLKCAECHEGSGKRIIARWQLLFMYVYIRNAPAAAFGLCDVLRGVAFWFGP